MINDDYNNTCTYLIMMATYNGAENIDRQIMSIIHQSVQNWELYIQDDGSNDNTYDILEKYQKNDTRIHVLKNESGNHGAYQNFNVLINKCKKMPPHKFYLFSDQDDIWDKDKLRIFTEQYYAKKCNDDIPVLMYADMRIVDSNENELCESLCVLEQIERNEKSIFFDASVWGCNLFFNFALMNDIPIIPDNATRVWGHDQYFARWASITGRLIYVNQITMQYRRHLKNVSSSVQVGEGFFAKVLKRMLHIDRLAFDHAVSYKSALFIMSLANQQDLCEAKRKELADIERVIYTGGLFSVIYYVKNKISLGKATRTISHLLILALNLHKKHLIKIE